jgi:hypothetical protein
MAREERWCRFAARRSTHKLALHRDFIGLSLTGNKRPLWWFPGAGRHG